jgi:hypothetical protein
MEQFINILIGLSTALVGYIIGRVWQHLVDWLPYRQAKLFLGPTIRNDLQVVTSRFKMPAFPDGVVGGGDALALRELATFLGRIGFKRFSTIYVDERHLNRSGNLILLGGLDTNQVTMDAMELISPNLTIVDPGPGIRMEVHDLAPRQECDDVEVEGTRPLRRIYKAVAGTDYGIIIRARNPFNPSRVVIIVAGAYGYGTWAGIDLIQQDLFLQKCKQLDMSSPSMSSPRMHSVMTCLRLAKAILRGKGIDQQWTPLECIFKVRIFDDRPLVPEIIVFRPLP